MSASDLPQSSRKKRLHFVWFIDSSKTKRLSLPLGLIYFSIAFFIFIFVLSCAVFAWNLDLNKQLFQTKQFVSELKESVFQLSAQTKEIPATKKEVAAEKHLMVEKQIEKPSEKQIAIAPAVAPTNILPSSSQEKTPTMRRSHAAKVLFTRISLEHISEASTLLKFDVQPAVSPSAKPFAGWVCVIAELVDASTSSFPEGLEEDSPCRGGQFVRFSKLRPTRIYLPVLIDKIKKLDFVFEESESRIRHTLEYTKK